MNSITPEEAVDLIEEFYRRCWAKFGDFWLLTPDENDIQWLRQQANAWPYGDPNLFRRVADQADEEPSKTPFRIPDKPTLLTVEFQLNQEQIDGLQLQCPLCGSGNPNDRFRGKQNPSASIKA